MNHLPTEPEPATSPAASTESTALPASAASPPQPAVDGSRTRILDVDDDRSLRTLVERVPVQEEVRVRIKSHRRWGINE